MERKHVVVMGGGTGTYTVLKGLREYPLDLTAVVTMADDGGSTGRLRDEYGFLPAGDIRRCLIALSEAPELMKRLFEYRFPSSNGGLSDHSLGNLIISALPEICGSTPAAFSAAHKLLNVRGRVLPVTLDPVRLHAELSNGQVVNGETHIDVPKHDTSFPITRVYLEPTGSAYPETLDAIAQADAIIFGPGDVYTSIVPNLLVDGISDAIRKSKSKKFQVINLTTKLGETNGYMVSNFVETIQKYLGIYPDVAIYHNSEEDNSELLLKYAAEGKYPVIVDRGNFSKISTRFIEGNLARRDTLLRHDSKKLAEIIVSQL